MIYKTFEEFMKEVSDSAVKGMTPLGAQHFLNHWRYWKQGWDKGREYPQDKINRAIELIKKNQHTHEYNYLMQDIFNILDEN